MKKITVLVFSLGLTFLSSNAFAQTSNLGLDLNEYCRKKFGNDWTQFLYNEQKAAGWRCITGSGPSRKERGINMNEACQMKYGSRFGGENRNGEASGWFCEYRG